VKIDFGKELNTEAKAWKTIWSAGQGAAMIDDVLSVHDLVNKLKKEFKSAIEEQVKLLKTFPKIG
jgi:nitronate monooxygenase